MNRLAVAALCIFWSTACLLANPNPQGKPPGPPLDRLEVQNYATQLFEITRWVSHLYVRPVSQPALVESALRGLYEAAHLPVPRHLRIDIDRAAARDPEDRESNGLVLHSLNNQGGRAVKDFELRRFLAAQRERLGNPEALRGDRALRVSLQNMLQGLDPFCSVVSGAELLRSRGAEPMNGLGLELLDYSGVGSLIVGSVAPGGPAQRAGMRPGDLITHVKDRAVDDRDASSLHLFRGDSVALTVRRPNEAKARVVTLRATSFHAETVLGVIRNSDNSWDYFVDHERRIAHIRLTSLDSGTAEELLQVLTDLNGQQIRGIILDLRWSPGGYLSEARDIADLFLGEWNASEFLLPTPGSLVAQFRLGLWHHPANATVQYRDGAPDDRMKRVYGSFPDFPMVVLVNGETSGGAELIAAVLQDNHRAVIAGQRTRGKASVQSIRRLDGADDAILLTVPVRELGMKLTSGILVRPSGKNLNRFPDSRPPDTWGVLPNTGCEIRVSAELSRRLHDWWLLQNLRPGEDTESLPLDDPVADPQRQTALQLLRRMLK